MLGKPQTYVDHIINSSMLIFFGIGIYLLGFMYGFILLCIVGTVFNRVMSLACGGKLVHTKDEMLSSKQKNFTTVMFAKVEKFDLEEFKTDSLRRALREEKLNSKVINFFGSKFWKKIDDKEIKQKIGSIFIEK